MQRWLQPLARTDLALIAQPMMIARAAAFNQQPHRLLNLVLVRIALFDDPQRNAVSAKDKLRILPASKGDKALFTFSIMASRYIG